MGEALLLILVIKNAPIVSSQNILYFYTIYKYKQVALQKFLFILT